MFDFLTQMKTMHRWQTLPIQSPGFETIVVTLAGNLAVLEFEEHGGVGSHLRSRAEIAEG
jgi:hypothetical protein